MKAIRRIAFVLIGATVWITSTGAWGQVVINEIVEDEQDFDSTVDVDPDTREFIELYNAGNSAVNIGDWTTSYIDLANGSTVFTDTIPSGTMLASHDYFVLGANTVPNVDLPLGANIELLPNFNTIFQLRNNSGTMVDAVALETFRGPTNGQELANATQEQLDQIAAGQTVGNSPRGGWWGQEESNNAHPTDTTTPNLPLSIGRYLDGRDSNINGRDFGMMPATPGTTNNLQQVAVHDVTDVNSLTVNTVLRDDFYASFKLPRVINPAVASAYNPNVIAASPQGGNAIVAWDETGGGNAAYSDEYTNKFKLYAFIDPRPFNVTTADSHQDEASIYGIGTTDTFFATPNSADLLTGQPGTGGNLTSTANGSTGFGWLIQRRTSNVAGTQNSKAVLQLIDFNDGGDSVLTDSDWQVKTTIDLTGLSAGWHVLSVDYNPATGSVSASYDNQTFNFNTLTGLVGNFYIGYREGLPGVSGGGTARPPTYDLFVPTGVPGDYNGNGIVDGADYIIYRDHLGTAFALPNEVAATTPGQVTVEDYTAWRARFGNTSGSGAGQFAGNVPEPSTIALVALGLVAMAASRRRRTS